MSESLKAVFLSYASQDAEAVLRIAEALRAEGVEVWFDRDELVGGDAWDAKIRGQIASCALFVPVISHRTQTHAAAPIVSKYLRFSLFPKLRSAMPMSNGQNPNGVSLHRIRDEVAEYFEVHAAIAGGADSRDRRMRLDPGDNRPRFVLQPDPEPRLDLFVAGNGLAQLKLGFRDNPRLHYGKRRSRSENTSVAGRDRAVPSSTARRRRAISSSQAASTSGEKSWSESEVSRRIRAKVRRSASGSSSASRVTSDSPFVMNGKLGDRHFRSTGNL
jgi:hypothetical protein